MKELKETSFVLLGASDDISNDEIHKAITTCMKSALQQPDTIVIIKSEDEVVLADVRLDTSGAAPAWIIYNYRTGVENTMPIEK